MDLFAHMLWTGALYKIAGRKAGRKFNLVKAVFWGIFPDLFAFGLPILLIVIDLALGKFDLSLLPRPDNMEPPLDFTRQRFQLASSLYNISHSLIIFSVVIAAILGAKLLARRQTPSPGKIAPLIPWEMGGWIFHILLDIPSHSYGFFPTPFLWPIYDFKFNGVSWRTPWFLAVNYIFIILVYYFFVREKKKRLS